jgi:hypothetical protein
MARPMARFCASVRREFARLNGERPDDKREESFSNAPQ